MNVASHIASMLQLCSVSPAYLAETKHEQTHLQMSLNKQAQLAYDIWQLVHTGLRNQNVMTDISQCCATQELNAATSAGASCNKLQKWYATLDAKPSRQYNSNLSSHFMQCSRCQNRHL